ncbi:AAA family ATPase [Dactylosporangium sp. CA-139114]|uniref:AAA family ATPase n=1 Tax=Dactylosporangium sp. CA-139114 TaxID=3239931 RepID=UPI003D976434
MTRRFVLTGAPGAGKTTIGLALRERGYTVVDEAATDVIAETPEIEQDGAAFLARILHVQRQRHEAATGALQIFDRSPVCTLALAEYLGMRPSRELTSTAEQEGVYERTVFFVRLMDFIVPTAARRIGLEESRRFERIHEDVYRRLGYTLVDIPPAPLPQRIDAVIAGIG